MDSVADFLASVLDEVALEGLDGITLTSLWFRLGKRPHFSISLDEDSKIFLWECIAIHKEVEIYELPEPRPILSLFNRFDYIDNESGVICEPEILPKDVYSIQQVKDGEIRGCCSTYKSRKCITSDIRYDNVLLLALNQVVEKWGDSLVLVASPKCRLLALTGTAFNPLTELSIEEYCLLERIGRSRYLGESSQGDSGLVALKAPYSKQLHYYCKKLSCKGLVTKQKLYLRNKKGCNSSGRLFHLARFYVQQKSKMQLILKEVCDFLLEKPNYCEETKVIREGFNLRDKNFKRLFHPPYNKCLKLVSIRYRELYPDAPPAAYLHSRGQEREIRVVKLLKHCDEEDEDDETSEIKENNLEHYYFDYTKIFRDLPLTTQAYLEIKNSGAEGLSLVDLCRITTLPRLDARNIIRRLIKKGDVTSYMKDKGKQKERKYILKEFTTTDEVSLHINKQNGIEDEISLQNENEVAMQEENETIFQDGNINETILQNENLIEKPSKKRSIAEIEEKMLPKSKKVKFNDVVDTVIYEEEKNASIASASVLPKSFEHIVSDVIKMQNTEIRLKKTKSSNEDLDKPIENQIIKSSRELTTRFIQRANLILEFLKAVKLSTASEIQKFLTEKEKEEGYSFKLDRKSTARVINILCQGKKLKLCKADIDVDGVTRHLEFICDASASNSDDRIRAAIDEAKFKYYDVGNSKGKKSKGVKAKISTNKKVLEAKENLVDKSLPKKQLVFQPSVGRLFYGLQPKFIRAKTLHIFLCYLTRSYEGSLENITDEPLVYHNSMNWKRFIPPLTDYNKKIGWCFLADAIARMPLSIFLKVVNIRYQIPGIEEYLGNEGKEHYLIKHLPQELRNDLLQNRKYIFAITEVVKTLCYMGLVTFGPQVQHLKDQVYVYVHLNVRLIDTTLSTPGYIYVNQTLTYPRKDYEFNVINDVDAYWIDLETICLHTPLGRYGIISGKSITFTEASHKPELIKALKAKDFDDVADNSAVPGDGLGAGGLDSMLFAHLKRNWCWGSIPWNKLQSNENQPLGACPMQSLLKTNETISQIKHSRLQRLTKNTSVVKSKEKQIKKPTKSVAKEKASKDKNLTEYHPPKSVKKKGLRTLVRKDTKKPRRPYYDDKDKAALKKMSKFRCDWTAQEDSFLLLCKVASAFLDPKSRRLVVPYTIVRDLLQEHLPDLAANKSSRACQRRIIYMMRNPTTINNVAVFLGESKQDKSLVDEFSIVKPPLTKLDQWKILFTSLVKKLMTKFTRSASDRCKYIILPQTLSEFNKCYQITSTHNVFSNENPHKEPESVEDVYCSTLYALIVSSMAIVDEGSKWSYTLHKLYENYPESLLRSIISRLRKEKIIAAKKSSSKKELQRIHSSSIPYRFSITYENNLITKFPRNIFPESSDLYNMLTAADDFSSYEIQGKVTCGCTATILSLMMTDNVELHTEIPDQIIIFDSSLSKEVRSTIVERMIHTLSSKESDELSTLLNSEISSEIEFSQEKVVNNESSTSQSETKTGKMITETHSFTNASRFALYMLRQEYAQPPIDKVQHSQDYIVLNSCKVFCKLAGSGNFSDSSYPFLPRKVTNALSVEKCAIRPIINEDIFAEVSSSLNLFVPRQAFLNNQDYIKSLEIIYQDYSSQTLQDAQCIFDQIFQSEELGVSEDVLLRNFGKLSGTFTIFEHLLLLREAILVLRVGTSSFRYVAVTYAKHWVTHSFKHKNFDESLSVNESEREAFEVTNYSNATSGQLNMSTPLKKNHLNADALTTATSANKYDQVQNLKSSASNDGRDNYEETMNVEDHSPSKTDDTNSCNISQNEIFYAQTTAYEDVHFITRTWRKPDGTLNSSEFFKLLLTVLSYIISTPGVTEQQVCDRFSGVMQSVQTLELIEVLEKIQCIYKFFCKPVTKRSLFSPLPDLYVTKTQESGALAHLESSPHAVFKVTKLKEHVDRNMKSSNS